MGISTHPTQSCAKHQHGAERTGNALDFLMKDQNTPTERRDDNQRRPRPDANGQTSLADAINTAGRTGNPENSAHNSPGGEGEWFSERYDQPTREETYDGLVTLHNEWVDVKGRCLLTFDRYAEGSPGEGGADGRDPAAGFGALAKEHHWFYIYICLGVDGS